MQNESGKNTAIIGIIAVVLIALTIGGTIALKSKSDKTNTNTSNTSSSDSTGSSSQSNQTSKLDSTATYKDGTYSATGKYSSPGGNEEIDVEITISQNKITTADVSPQAASRESMEYQDDFVSGYKSQVVGKDITTLKLSKISGSSLTPRGFNEALDNIRNQAKV